MKRLLILAAAALVTVSCAGLRNHDSANDAPYANPFYAKYLNTGSAVDAQISNTLEALRQTPDSPELHNRLGTLLVDKGFPKDAEREFERSVNANRKFHPAWYNLGLIRAAQGDELGARRAFSRTVDLKPGHAPALFQLGLVEEKNHHTERAVRLYAKAYTINPALLRVDVNPRVLDSDLTDLALLRMYKNDHTKRSMQFEGAVAMPAPVGTSAPPTAPSPQPQPKNIVTPAPPATASQVSVEPTPMRAPTSAAAPDRRSTRGRQPRPVDPNAPTPVPVQSNEPPPMPSTPPPTPPV
jgi:tetratricopeptide (TPR) repeat protein